MSPHFGYKLFLLVLKSASRDEVNDVIDFINNDRAETSEVYGMLVLLQNIQNSLRCPNDYARRVFTEPKRMRRWFFLAADYDLSWCRMVRSVGDRKSIRLNSSH